MLWGFRFRRKKDVYSFERAVLDYYLKELSIYLVFQLSVIILQGDCAFKYWAFIRELATG